MHCLEQPNQVIHFLFHIAFIIKISSESFKQSTCTLYASTGEMPIDWSFFLRAWYSVNSLSVSVTISTLFDHQCSESVSNKNLVLHWRKNSCPGTTWIFLVYSCWAIWRVNTCSPGHLITWSLVNFATIFHQYCTTLTFPPLKNITKHLFIV